MKRITRTQIDEVLRHISGLCGGGKMGQSSTFRFWVFTCLIIVSACNAPSWHFRDLPAQNISVEGSVFEVRQRGDLAEAIRINAQYAPRLGLLRGQAERAISAVTGCDVMWVLGDQAQMLARLSCPSET